MPTAFTVTTIADDGVGSLRQAISRSETGDTIVFDQTLAGQTIALTSRSEIPLDKSITIDGRNVPHIAISGVGQTRVFEVAHGVSVILEGLTITDGRAEKGAGLLNNGALTLSDCSVTSNLASGAGAGVDNEGTLALSRSTVSANSSGSQGGGVLNGQSSAMTVVNCTFNGNTASDGGGVMNLGGILTVTNSTLSKNAVGDSGGGIDSVGGMVVAGNTMIADNTANTSSSPDYTGTINSEGHNLIGVADATSGWDASRFDQTGTAAMPLDPRLAPLADNGGPTWTMALLPGSPAIGAGNASVLGPPLNLTTDQRGQARFSPVDVGAFQTAPSNPTLVLTTVTVNATAGVSLVNVPVASFTSLGGPSTPSSYSATIDWGDGQPLSTGIVASLANGFMVVGSHTYANPTTYVMKVTVRETSSGVSEQTEQPLAVAPPRPPGIGHQFVVGPSDLVNGALVLPYQVDGHVVAAYPLIGGETVSLPGGNGGDTYQIDPGLTPRAASHTGTFPRVTVTAFAMGPDDRVTLASIPSLTPLTLQVVGLAGTSSLSVSATVPKSQQLVVTGDTSTGSVALGVIPSTAFVGASTNLNTLIQGQVQIQGSPGLTTTVNALGRAVLTVPYAVCDCGTMMPAVPEKKMTVTGGVGNNVAVTFGPPTFASSTVVPTPGVSLTATSILAVGDSDTDFLVTTPSSSRWPLPVEILGQGQNPMTYVDQNPQAGFVDLTHDQAGATLGLGTSGLRFEGIGLINLTKPSRSAPDTLTYTEFNNLNILADLNATSPTIESVTAAGADVLKVVVGNVATNLIINSFVPGQRVIVNAEKPAGRARPGLSIVGLSSASPGSVTIHSQQGKIVNVPFPYQSVLHSGLRTIVFGGGAREQVAYTNMTYNASAALAAPRAPSAGMTAAAAHPGGFHHGRQKK